MTISQEAYLEHYGVKGMKWGVRKQRETSGRSRVRKERPDTRSENRKTYDATRQKRISEMSDDELKAVVNRMNMEKQYKSLSTELYSPGKFYAQKALKTTGNIAIGALGGYAVNKAGAPLAKKAGKAIGRAVMRRVVRR